MTTPEESQTPEFLYLLDPQNDKQRRIIDFFNNPEKLRPSRRALLQTTQRILERLDNDARLAPKYARTEQEQQVAQLIKDLKKALFQRIFSERDNFKPKEPYPPDPLTLRFLEMYDKFLTEQGKNGIIEMVQKVILFETKVNVAMIDTFEGPQPRLIVKHTFTMPYTIDTKNRLLPQKETISLQNTSYLPYDWEEWFEIPENQPPTPTS